MTGREAEARLARLVVLPANAVDAADIVIPGATEGSAAEGLAAEAPGSTTISLGCAGAWAPSPSVRTWTAVALVTTRGSEPARAFFASAEPGSGPCAGSASMKLHALHRPFCWERYCTLTPWPVPCCQVTPTTTTGTGTAVATEAPVTAVSGAESGAKERADEWAMDRAREAAPVRSAAARAFAPGTWLGATRLTKVSRGATGSGTAPSGTEALGIPTAMPTDSKLRTASWDRRRFGRMARLSARRARTPTMPQCAVTSTRASPSRPTRRLPGRTPADPERP